MESKELAEMLDIIQYKTGKSLEEIAADIGYSRPYLNKVKLSGSGDKVSGILKATYGEILQNVRLGEKKEVGADPLSIIANLTESNRMLAEANLILANKINSSVPASVSSSSKGKGKVLTDPTEEMQPGKQETSFAGKKKQKDSVQH